MTQFVIANNVNTQLATAALSSATTLTLASSVNLPTLSAGQIMPLTLNDAATGLIYEVVYVTAISGVTLTVTRAQEGTGAQNWSIGDYAFCAPTAGTVATATGNSSNTFQVAPATATNMAPTMAQAAGVVGSVRNLVMNVAAASASATLTADEIIVETALGGLRYCLPSFNKTINLATTGAGGMDTGTAPVSGYVALYAIYNPTTQTAALLATNATSAVAPNVYGGANMPAGYTASALVSVWPTNSSSNLIVGFQIDREVTFASTTALTTSTAATSFTALSISSIVPKNARNVSGNFRVGQSTSSVTYICDLEVASTSAGIGTQSVNVDGTNSTDTNQCPFRKLAIATAQTIYYLATASAGTGGWTIFITGYEF